MPRHCAPEPASPTQRGRAMRSSLIPDATNFGRIRRITPSPDALRALSRATGRLVRGLHRRWPPALAALVLTCLAVLAAAPPSVSHLPDIGLVILGGLLVALTTALLLDRLDPVLREPSDIESALGLPVLGALPAPT